MVMGRNVIIKELTENSIQILMGLALKDKFRNICFISVITFF